MHKAISLSAELAEIRNAVEGALFLADELATGGLEDRKRELQVPLTISAILAWWNCGSIRSSTCCGGGRPAAVVGARQGHPGTVLSREPLHLSTTQRYMHLSPAAKDAAISLLDEVTSQISGDILETEIAPKEKPGG